MDAIEYMTWLATQPPGVQDAHHRAAVTRMNATTGGFFNMSPHQQTMARAEADLADAEIEAHHAQVLATHEAKDYSETDDAGVAFGLYRTPNGGSSMTLSEELRAAATRLREWTTGASEGPWFHDGDGDRVWQDNKHHQHGYTVAADVDYDNALWIAAMSPLVAEPLARWLEWEADEVRPDQTLNPEDYPPLLLARLILEADS